MEVGAQKLHERLAAAERERVCCLNLKRGRWRREDKVTDCLRALVPRGSALEP